MKRGDNPYGKNFKATGETYYEPWDETLHGPTPDPAPVAVKDSGTTGTYGYSYDQISSADCDQLKTMIAEMEYGRQQVRMTQAAYADFQARLDYAYKRFSSCEAVPPTLPYTPDAPVQVETGDPTIESPTIPVGEIVPASNFMPTSGGGAGLPFGSGGGGGGGSAAPGTPEAKKIKNWLWLVVASSLVLGYFSFGGKNIAGGTI